MVTLSSGNFIVAGEIIRIHTYLTQAPRLRFIEGASRLLEIFSKRIVPALAEWLEPDSIPLVAAAARFLVVFKDIDNAEKFLQLADLIATILLGQGRLVQSGPMENQGDEEKVLNEIRASLEKKKTASPAQPPTIPGLQFMEQCHACGAWGVAQRYQGRLICALCNYKTLARDGKEIEIDLSRIRGPQGGLPRGILISPEEKDPEIKEREKNAELVYVSYEKPETTEYRNFHEMGRKDPTGYIGLFYADGNSMGTLFGKRKTLSEYSQFSNEISKKNDVALARARKSVIDSKGNFPGVIFIKGGDDLLAVFPATKALEFAKCFLEQITEDPTPFEEGVCAALVLSVPSMPFTTLWDQAEELLKNAKSQVWIKLKDKRDIPPAEKSAIDFRQVSTSLLSPLKSQPERMAYLAHKLGTYHLITARPYILREFGELLEKLKEFHSMELPQSSIMRLKEIFRPGTLDASRVDEQGKFVELERLISRLETLRPETGGIRNIFNLNLKQSEWKYPEYNRSNSNILQDAQRHWQGDMVELVNFVEP